MSINSGKVRLQALLNVALVNEIASRIHHVIKHSQMSIYMTILNHHMLQIHHKIVFYVNLSWCVLQWFIHET